MQKSVHAGVALLLLWTSFDAHAMPVLDIQGGLLVGASGVDVNGVLYDVAFVDGSCTGLFDGCDASSDFAFQSEGDATDASQALLDQVLLDGTSGGLSGSFDTLPFLTNGCPSAGIVCLLFTPFSLDGGLVEGIVAENDEFEILDQTAFHTLVRSDDTGVLETLVYAVWTVQALPVPEPGVLFLLCAGLVGLGMARRYRFRG